MVHVIGHRGTLMGIWIGTMLKLHRNLSLALSRTFSISNHRGQNKLTRNSSRFEDSNLSKHASLRATFWCIIRLCQATQNVTKLAHKPCPRTNFYFVSFPIRLCNKMKNDFWLRFAWMAWQPSLSAKREKRNLRQFHSAICSDIKYVGAIERVIFILPKIKKNQVVFKWNKNRIRDNKNVFSFRSSRENSESKIFRRKLHIINNDTAKLIR